MSTDATVGTVTPVDPDVGTAAPSVPSVASGRAEAPDGPPGRGREHPRLSRTLARMTSHGSGPAWVNALVIVVVTGIAFWQLQPALLFTNTTITGGDTGAHVALPAFLQSGLLPHWRLTGWDPGWYDGFPLYTFYFPLPGVITVVLNAVLPYNIAFKLVTALGTLLLPVSAWGFGRLARLRDPMPAALAALTLPFLFEPSFSIYGLNILSTLAGEYSESLGLVFALLFLGLVARRPADGRHRAIAAVLLAASLLCHLLTGIFALVGAAVWLVLDGDLRRVVFPGVRGRVARRRWLRRCWWAVVAVAVGLLLTAWWLVPFAAYQAYTTNMGWQNVYGFWHLLFPSSAYWVLALDVVALVTMVVRRNRVALFIVVMGALSAAAVCFMPQGKLYNVRFLPFWFLCLYLLAGLGVGEAVGIGARAVRRRRLTVWATAVASRMPTVPVHGWRPGMRITRIRRPVPSPSPAGWLAGALAALAVALIAVLPPLTMSASSLKSVGVTVDPDHVVAAWAAYNYSGYEEMPAYPEYHSVVQMMAKVGATDGCGRTMWEYDPSLNRFGTTMSLMLLPYWTSGCIDSMEGLLFESSATTPYHFLNQDELSTTPSEAVVGLGSGPGGLNQYAGLNVPLGVDHLQMLGVRYFLASSPDVEAAAAADRSLTLVATSGPWPSDYSGTQTSTTWKVYRVADSSLVQPLAKRPVVWTDVAPGQNSWMPASVAWYQDPSRWQVVPAAGGPAQWTRLPASDTRPAAVAEPVTHVSGVVDAGSSVHFHVDRIGTPVEVRISYFPNWQASGAEGPWRVAPNLMVVVPTSHDVTLTYGTSPPERLGWALTAAGLVAVVVLAVVGRRRRRARMPVPALIER